ncbi:hypothetical protein ACFQ08_00105 [Streptosporangium algeriense]|uniref:Uncharacterized protein n=1 Tax=Streptosporangium algeriense TaxID=1682748 RepID=A0ABW3DGZ1_9ACTN
MNPDFEEDDLSSATALIAFGFRPRLRPHRDAHYASLIRRYEEDPSFKMITGACAAGLSLRIVGVSTLAGIVLAALPGSPFETKFDQYARQARQHRHRDAERILHGIAHLAIAAISFPRPADLADNGYVGRATIASVDALVRDICEELSTRADSEDENTDPPLDAPDLEKAWRVYQRRPDVGSTSDGRAAIPSTEAIVTRALNYLVDQGMMTPPSEDEARTDRIYRTTSRYQIQVRDLASVEAFDELLRLNAAAVLGEGATLRVRDHDDSLY